MRAERPTGGKHAAMHIAKPYPKLSNINRYRQMSSPVSPRQRDIGEVARLRAEGVDRQPRSGFPASRETEKLRSCNVDPIRTPPPAAPPLSALCARQRRTLLRFPILQFNFHICSYSPHVHKNTPYLHRGGHCNIASTATIKDRKNDHTSINSKLSIITP